MRKIGAYLIILTLIFQITIVLSENSSDSKSYTPPGAAEEQHEKIQKNIDKIPLNEDGTVDEEKLNSTKFFFYSKAEKRIAEVNTWLKDNASWLRFVFGMVPSISWTFAWEIYIMIIFLTIIVLNAPFLWTFITDKTASYIFGAAIFLILLVLRAYYYLAQIIVNIFRVIYETVLPWGIIIATILVIILSIFAGYIMPFIPRIIMFLMKIAPFIPKHSENPEIDKAKELNRRQEEAVKKIEGYQKGLGN